MSLTIEQDRSAQLLLGSDTSLTYDEARWRLDRAALVLSADDVVKTAPGQAALLTAARCATRMFHGGVYLARQFPEPTIVGGYLLTPLERRLQAIGCRTEAAPPHAYRIHIGSEQIDSQASLACWADGWVATVSPRAPSLQPVPGNEISGALAGAMVVSEAFRAVVLKDLRAAKRTQRLSPLTPSDPQAEGLKLQDLPSRLWLVGLGNLGQAALWVLGLLPFADPENVELVLQDDDVSGPENLDTQILTDFSWIGSKKARVAAEWAERRGFRATISEQRFLLGSRRSATEPGLVLVGVDNLGARRACAAKDAGFDLVIDAGLGASAAEIFDIRVHCFPGGRSPEAAWPNLSSADEKPLNEALSKLVADGRLTKCGALMIAGHPVGVPSTAVAAATIQIAQACRAVHEGSYCDLVDVSLADTKRASATSDGSIRVGVLPSSPARSWTLPS